MVPMSWCRPCSWNQVGVQRSTWSARPHPPEAAGQEIGLEYRLKDDLGRLLAHPVLDSSDAQGAHAPVGLFPCCGSDEAAGLVSGGTTARTLAPSKEAFDTPLSPPSLGDGPGPLPGSPAITRTGLSPAGLVQLSGRNTR